MINLVYCKQGELYEKRRTNRLIEERCSPCIRCTEPVCVALYATYASKQLNNPINKIELDVNKGIYKNGMSAGIPHCEHVGLEYAASIGALLKNPEKQLTLFEDIGSDTITQAELLVPHVSITINDSAFIHVKCTLHTSNETVTCMHQRGTYKYSLSRKEWNYIRRENNSRNK